MIFEIDSFGDPVGDGVTGARYCFLGGVVKVDVEGSELAVANEYIVSRLATLLGLPVPPGAIAAGDGGQRAFVSLRFGQKGERPPPAILEEIVDNEPRMAAGIVAFDCWIANTDRHSKNVAYSRDPDIPLAIFDHERALAGTERAKLPSRLLELVDKPNLAGMFVGATLDGAQLLSWAQDILALPTFQIRDACRSVLASGAMQKWEVDLIERFLLDRRPRLADFLRTLPNIPGWGLNP